ncbi:hypothetical protein HAX54_006418 [Datura stramonium]|uniref:Uncharacterized protein n=1 Tax=Datura stramonium TaxID=4076 RepID=A0ABS8TA93_DATST|nr:hypothetical protein [Datura stramonium]
MAYTAITCLMRTIHQSMEITGCDLQPFYEKLESLRAILEKTCNITGDLEALTRLEAEITELAYSAEDVVDSKSRKVLFAQNAKKHRRAFWKLCCSLEQEVEHIDSIMMQWLEIRNWYNKINDFKEQKFSLVSIPEHAVENSRVKCDEPFDELADQLQKLLKGEYLIVIDDIWTTGAWDDINLCFPDYCNNGSRILLTTRNVDVAEYAISGKPPYHMRLMNFDESWSLLYEKVFVNECFPPEFEQLGKQIALKCGGLPLAITVIAGLLSKIGKALSEWQSVAENVSSAVRTDVDVQCMRVLSLSYHYLPHHLKPCFLYFALFPEDELIFVSKIMRLWAADGFLKVEDMKSIEEVAEKCLKELTYRSLISIQCSRFDGKITSCGMHDVTRELCLREAQNMNFVYVLGGKNHQNPCGQSMQCPSKSRGRISIRNKEELTRCCNTEAHSVFLFGTFRWFLPEVPFKLVRVLDLSLISCPFFPSGILYLIHLRYLALCFTPRLEQCVGSKEEVPSSIIDIPSSISSLCYLQSFIIYHQDFFDRQKFPLILPSEILTMPQLRHLHLDWNYLRYLELTEQSLVLKNLECLSGWNPWYCTCSAFRLFPNLNNLLILGVLEDFLNRKDLYDFRYLDKLEELTFLLIPQINACFLDSNNAPSGSTPQHPLRLQMKMLDSPLANDVPSLLLPPPDVFPQNLKNLAFTGPFCLHWKDMSIVGKLPKLESLKLSYVGFTDEEWEVAEEGFPHLKFLLLKYLDIRYWRASSDHFPCLERLFLHSCWYLESIPQDFAEITTLALIDISNCRKSVGNSAKQIQQDIQDNYGGSAQVHISDTV